MVRLSDVLSGFPTPVAGEPGDPGLFGPGSAVWSINSRTALLLGGGRALLLQLAHPLVAAGVADHSGFERDPWERLWGTLGVVLDVTFGDTTQARAAVRGVTNKHLLVKGERAGSPYDAMDPALLMWVHATLVDSALETHERLIGPVGDEKASRYYQEMKTFAREFGVPDDRLPEDLSSFRAYVGSMISGLRVSSEARRLADLILRPPVPSWGRPARFLQRSITISLLPREIREGFGFDRIWLSDLASTGTCWGLRVLQPLLPRSVTIFPHARAALDRSRLGGRSPRSYGGIAHPQ